MTDGQLEIIAGAIVTGCGILGGLVRWSAGIIRSMFTTTLKVIDDNTKAFGKLSEFLGRVDVRTDMTHSRMVEIHSEISDVHSVPIPPSDFSASEAITPAETPKAKKFARAKTPRQNEE